MSTTHRSPDDVAVHQHPARGSRDGVTSIPRFLVDARLALYVVGLGALTVATWPLLAAPPAPGVFGVPLVPTIAHGSVGWEATSGAREPVGETQVSRLG